MEQELREKIANIIAGSTLEVCPECGAKTHLPSEITDKIEAVIKEAGYVKLELIEKQIWKSVYILPDNKQKVINGIRQAGGK